MNISAFKTNAKIFSSPGIARSVWDNTTDSVHNFYTMVGEHSSDNVNEEKDNNALCSEDNDLTSDGKNIFDIVRNGYVKLN